MKILNNLLDSFKAADFEVSEKMSVKELQEKFTKNFGLHLRIYEVGTGFAPPTKYLSNINGVKTNAEGFTIKATWTAKEVQEKFKEAYNLKVRVAFEKEGDKELVPDITKLGDAKRIKNLK